MDSSVDLLSTI